MSSNPLELKLCPVTQMPANCIDGHLNFESAQLWINLRNDYGSQRKNYGYIRSYFATPTSSDTDRVINNYHTSSKFLSKHAVQTSIVKKTKGRGLNCPHKNQGPSKNDEWKLYGFYPDYFSTRHY